MSFVFLVSFQKKNPHLSFYLLVHTQQGRRGDDGRKRIWAVEHRTKTEDENAAEDEVGELFLFNLFFRNILLTFQILSLPIRRRGGWRTATSGGGGRGMTGRW